MGKMVSAKQFQELEGMLNQLKKKHKRKFANLKLNYGDIGNTVAIGKVISDGAFAPVTPYVGYISMWHIIHANLYPIEKNFNLTLK